MPESDFDEAAWRERLASFRTEKAAYLQEDPDAPLGDEDADEDLSWFPLDPEYRVVARYQPTQTTEEVALPSTTGPDRTYERAATFGFTLDGEHQVLVGYRHESQNTLFVPFTDDTNGVETPDIGRYLDVDPGDAGVGDDVVLEFNLAHRPYATYSDHYASTIPPADNHVSVRVEAGERLPE